MPAASAAIRTAPPPVLAASSDSSSQHRPASSASAWSRHGATPSASLGASARIPAWSSSRAGRTRMFVSSIYQVSHRRPRLINGVFLAVILADLFIGKDFCTHTTIILRHDKSLRDHALTRQVRWLLGDVGRRFGWPRGDVGAARWAWD